MINICIYNSCIEVRKIFYRTIYALIRSGHRITDEVSQELKEFDITEPQYNVLKILKGAKEKPLSVQKIQSAMVQRSSNVTRIIDKLLKKGCVDRQECPSNRRKMDIRITSEGLALLKKLDKKVQALHEPMRDRLTEKELDLLRKLLNKLIGEEDE